MSEIMKVHVSGFDNLKRDFVGNILNFQDLTVTGQENLFPLSYGPVIFNLFPHKSHLDSWTNRKADPKKDRLVYLAKAKYWGGWRRLFGELTNALILLDTDERAVPKAAIKTAVEYMHRGYSIGIAAEGTRSLRPLDERPFENGIRLILDKTQYKFPYVIPVLLQGFEHVWPPKQKLPWPFERSGLLFHRKKVRLHFAEPIKFDKEDKHVLVENLRNHCISQYRLVYGE